MSLSGRQWSLQPELAWQNALRAANRKLGPPRQATPFPHAPHPRTPKSARPMELPWAHRASRLSHHWLPVDPLKIKHTNLRPQNVVLHCFQKQTLQRNTSRTHTCMYGCLQGAPTLTTTVLCPACAVLKQHILVLELKNVTAPPPFSLHGKAVQRHGRNIVAAAHHLDPQQTLPQRPRREKVITCSVKELSSSAGQTLSFQNPSVGTPDAHFPLFSNHGQFRKPHQTPSAHESCHRQRPLATQFKLPSCN